MFALTIDQQRYSAAQLAALPGDAFDPALPPQTRAALVFCRQWLAGQTSFTVHTSGSTGSPKPITVQRAQMSASARATGQALGLRAGDTALVCLSTAHIAGLMMLVRGLELKLALTLTAPARNPLAGLPDAAHFDFCAFAPLQLQEILTATPAKRAILNNMKAILLGGAPVFESLAGQIKTLTVPVYHSYGMTETVSHIALRALNGCNASDYFVPLPGVALELDERGCLCIRAAQTDNRRIITNDRVELRPDGAFRWLGRSDNVINSGGVKVQAEKVEAVLEQLLRDYRAGLLANRRLLVGPLPDPVYGQTVAAVIEGEPVAPGLTAELRVALRDSGLLMPYEMPRRFYFRPCFVETPTGKIDRRASLAGLEATP